MVSNKYSLSAYAKRYSESGMVVYWVLGSIVATFAVAGVTFELAKYQKEGQLIQYSANAAATAAASQLCPVCDYISASGHPITFENINPQQRDICWQRAKHAFIAYLKQQGFNPQVISVAPTPTPVIVSPELTKYSPANNYYDFTVYRDSAHDVTFSIQRGMLEHVLINQANQYQCVAKMTNGRYVFQSLEFETYDSTQWPRIQNWADSVEVTISRDSEHNPFLRFIGMGGKETHYQRTAMATVDNPSCVIDTRARGSRPIAPCAAG